jgi:predicted enzyme related to lactoylglutathione lyase
MGTRRSTGKRSAPAKKAASKAGARKHAPVTPLARVTGIGGIFFKSDDPGKLMEWYRKHLGIEADAYGGWTFTWREMRKSSRIGSTVFSPFERASDYFEPSEEPYMFNFRVADLDGLLKALRRAGVHVIDKVEEHPYGRFGWIIDPEGRKIELWEPPDADDPFGAKS